MNAVREALPYVPAALAVKSFRHFVWHMWSVLEPGTRLKWNWHLDALCWELERVVRGEVKELLICIPPGMMKSLLTSVMLPAWWWLHAPHLRFMTLSGALPVASRDSRKMRLIVTSERYRELVDWGLAKDQNEKVNFENDHRGARLCFATGGSPTGSRGDVLIWDDPHQVKDLLGTPEQVAAALAKGVEKVTKVLPSRLNDQSNAIRIGIMQRLHPLDAAGVLLAAGVERVVCLPMEFDPTHPHRYEFDPRKEAGELLFPDFVPADRIAELKDPRKGLGPVGFAAQYNQRPIRTEGGKFRAEWFAQRFEGDPQRFAATCDEVIVSADCAASKSSTADESSIQVWGRKGVHKYLLHLEHGRWEYTELEARFVHVCKMFPSARRKLVEAASNGLALLSRKPVPGMIPVKPSEHGGKITRASYTETAARAGEIWLPQSSVAPWVEDWVAQHLAFPMGAHDDHVDAASQVMIEWDEAGRTDAMDGLDFLRDIFA